eukprot:1162137-Pelagomonas_calceolata.AAC.6
MSGPSQPDSVHARPKSICPYSRQDQAGFNKMPGPHPFDRNHIRAKPARQCSCQAKIHLSVITSGPSQIQ